eukprot:scaffold12.g8001.t1
MPSATALCMSSVALEAPVRQRVSLRLGFPAPSPPKRPAALQPARAAIEKPDRPQLVGRQGKEAQQPAPVHQRWAAVLAAFAAQHGRLPKSTEVFLHGGQELSLGKWLASRQHEERRGELDRQVKMAIEEAAGQQLAALLWTVQRQRLPAAVWCSALAAFVEQQGRLPKQREAFQHGGNHRCCSGQQMLLGMWLAHRRQEERKGELDPTLMAAIEEAVGPQLAAGLWMAAVHVKRLPPTVWCSALAAFAERHGRLPNTTETIQRGGQELSLGNWLAHRRQEQKKGTLSPQLKAAIEEAVGQQLAGELWAARIRRLPAAAWCSALAAFVEQQGRLPKEQELFQHRGQELPLGTWLADRRSEERRGKLDSQIKAAIEEAAGPQLDGGLWTVQRQRLPAATTQCAALAAFVQQHVLFWGVTTAEWPLPETSLMRDYWAVAGAVRAVAEGAPAEAASAEAAPVAAGAVPAAVGAARVATDGSGGSTSPRPANPAALLKRYAAGDFQFEGDQNRMADFVSAATRLAAEEPVLVLSTLGDTSGRGLQLVEEICSSDFSAQAGAVRKMVSLQRCVVPLLRLLTLNELANSPMTHLVNALLAADSLDLQRLAACLQQMVARRSVEDPFCRGGTQLAWPEFCRVLVDYLYAAYSKFADKRGALSVGMRTCVQALAALVAALPQAAGGAGQVASIQRRIQDINRLIDQHQQQEETHARMQQLRGQRQADQLEWQRLFGPRQGPGLLESGPGEIFMEGPRHNNDHSDIRHISIMPTQEEVESTLDPYLPRNAPGASAHLPAGSSAGHLDVHFKLFRHDLLAPLIQSLGLFQEMVRREGRGARLQGSRQQGGGQLRLREQDESKVDRIVFATVCDRDVRRLADPNPVMGVSLSKSLDREADVQQLLDLLLEGGARPRARTGLVMLQSAGSFFAYEPVLSALQRMGELPLAEYLAAVPEAAPLHPQGSSATESNGVIGFLGIPNRANVMLSRAKQGMYVIGNHANLLNAKKPGVWEEVIGMFEGSGLLGPSIEVACQKHPERRSAICHWRDFGVLAADARCYSFERRKCHVDDPGHKTVRCMKPCQRLHEPCGHACPKRCWEECSPCGVEIRDVQLPCGHVAGSLPCFRAAKPEEVACAVKTEVHMPLCGHTISVACADAETVAARPWRCTTRCGGTLGCGHDCGASCGGCLGAWIAKQLDLSRGIPPETEAVVKGSQLQLELPDGARALELPPAGRRQHKPCSRHCARLLFCGHECGARCHEQAAGASGDASTGCPVCSKPCASRPGVRMNVWRGCRGRRVPTLVPLLPEEEVSEDPLILLPCRHGYTMSFMDGYMGLESAYRRDQGSGAWLEPLPLPAEHTARRACMKCRQPLPQLLRYGRVLNKSLLDNAEKKFIQRLVRRAAPATRTDCCNAGNGSWRASWRLCGPPAPHPPCKSTTALGKALMGAEEAQMAGVAAFLQGLAQEQSIPPADLDAAMAQLIMPSPNATPFIEALLGRSMALADLGQVAATELQACINDSRGSAAGDQAGAARKAALQALARLHGTFDSAQLGAQIALDTAVQNGNVRLQVADMHTKAQLLVGQALALSSERSVVLAALLGESYQRHVASLDGQKAVLLDAAEQACDAALRLLADSYLQGGDIRRAELQELLRKIDSAKKQDCSEAEMREVFQAMTQADSSLRSAGWNGAGHFFTCPNGHPYAIGECGGAMETSRCPTVARPSAGAATG